MPEKSFNTLIHAYLSFSKDSHPHPHPPDKQSIENEWSNPTISTKTATMTNERLVCIDK